MRRSEFGYNNSKGFDSRVFPDTDVDFAWSKFPLLDCGYVGNTATTQNERYR